MRTLIAGLITITLFVGCDDPDPGIGIPVPGGEGGSSAGDGGAGTSPGSSGSSAGTAAAGRGGAMGTAGDGSSGSSGSGGSAQAGTGETPNGGKGSGGRNFGGAGSGGAGPGGAGSSNAGATGGDGPAGSGGTPGAGTGSGGDAGAGSGECTENIRCELDALPSTGDIHQDCVDRINQFRTECACLPPLERWTEGEACADQMAEYDSTAEEAHAGFQDDICAGGSAQNECPGWRSEPQVIEGCLQQMWDEGPPPQDPCNDACFQMYGHFINMTNERYTMVACGFFTTPGGEVWSVQNFSR